MTHDGFAEMWFDDLDALRQAVASSAWQAVSEDASRLGAQPTSLVIARERVIKG